MKKILLSIFILITSVIIYAQPNNFFSQSSKTLKDGNIELSFTVDLSVGWHVYSSIPIPNGPMPFTLETDDSSNYELVGQVKDKGNATTEFDSGFQKDVKLFTGKATFIQIIKPLTNQAFKVTGSISYQTCNGQTCLTNEESINQTISANKNITIVTDSTATTEIKTISNTNNPKKEKSLLMFLLIAFAAGLAGVFTPCVFPMIPMTVGFFVSGDSKKNGIIKGLIFAISVILLYTLLGLIVALFQTTTAPDTLGTHWIPNLIFALLFLTFAISFFGAFEITLPNNLANKADRKADKGGYVAAFFVAFAMVIVSFSCTGPFVGSILAAAVSDGVTLKPILGMAIFGLSFSLPFVIFSFFPGFMKKLPKSGGWLNTIKVIFAFVLFGFAIKYFYNVDAYFGWGIITRLGFLSIWIVLAILLGLYFLGVYRTKNDTKIEGLGWGRIMIVIVCFSFAVYIIPGLFGAPLKSISGLIPPKDGSTLVLLSQHTDNNTSIKGFSSLKTYKDLDKALATAKKENKPIFLMFKSHTCSVCKQMEATVLNESQVSSKLNSQFIVATLYIDDSTPDKEFKTRGKKYRNYETKTFGYASQPVFVIINTEGKILSEPIVGKTNTENFMKFLNY
ncbi:MAG: cytochrome c biogenesis protein CcdA [Bacteroidales bacterium]